MNQIINIENLIYNIRGVQVMLSSDVAKLYQVETKVLNQTIKRNLKRFPKEFCFQLTDEEIDVLSLRSQFVTLNKNNNLRGQHYKYLPYVLTEQGIMMLSGLLKSDIAVNINIKIIDTFVKMRKYFANESISKNVLFDHENRILKIEDTLNKFTKIEVNNLFFEGQIYDAYSLLIDILSKAKKSIIIIDNYAGKEILDIIKNINIPITIYSSNIDEELIKKYNKQYSNVTFKINDSFHDRFIILDKEKVYHSGASFKDLGKKCFDINEFNDKYTIDKLINYLNNTTD